MGIQDELDFDSLNLKIINILNTGKISKLYLDNMLSIFKMSVRYNLFMINSFNNKSIFSKKIKIDIKELLELSKIYLKSINKEYPFILDELYRNNSILFDRDVSSKSDFDLLKNKYIINIKREDNYVDVAKIVHEFMHYTNYDKSNTFDNTRKDLTEYISIYHELKSLAFLFKNRNVLKDKINFNNRFLSTYECSSDVMTYSYPLIAFCLNKLDENSHEFISKTLKIKLTKESFNNSALELSKLLDKGNPSIIAEFLNDSMNYLLSTYLAFYSYFNHNKSIVNNINHNINRINISSEELLYEYNIVLDNEFENMALNNMKKYVNKYIISD